MSYTEVTLVRHAEATHMDTPEIVAGWAPYSILTEEGIRQSQQLGETWARESYKPDETYSSPILRAMNTLQIAQIAGKLPLKMELEPLIAEQCLGVHEGKPRDVVYSEYTLWMIELHGALYRHQGTNKVGEAGESLLDTVRRMTNFLDKAYNQATEPTATVLAMSHRISITGLVSYIGLNGHREPVDPHDLKSHTLDRSRYDVQPCSRTLVVVEDGLISEKPIIRVEYVGEPLP